MLNSEELFNKNCSGEDNSTSLITPGIAHNLNNMITTPRHLITTFLIILFSSIGVASEFDDEMPTSSTLSLSNNYDYNYGNNDTNLFVDLEIPSHQHLQFSFGKSTTSDNLSNTRQIGVGISTDPYNSFSMGSELSYWGKSGLLESRTFRTDLSINLESLSVTYSPQLSVVSIYLDVAPHQIDIYALGNEFSLNYFGISDYSFSASYFINNYGNTSTSNTIERRIEALDGRIFSSRVQLLTSLEDNRIQLGIARYLNWGSLGIGWYYSNFAFVDSSSTNTIFTVDYNINKTIAIGIGYGIQTSSEDNSTFNTVNTALYVSW